MVDPLRETNTSLTIEEPPPEPLGRCQVCGAPHAVADPILCPRCGEPVLLWGWAP